MTKHVNNIQLCYRNNKGVSNANITIQNGIVTIKGQFGLNSNKSDITLDKYNKIEKGLTYEQVKAILGEGQVLSETEIAKQKAIVDTT